MKVLSSLIYRYGFYTITKKFEILIKRLTERKTLSTIIFLKLVDLASKSFKIRRSETRGIDLIHQATFEKNNKNEK